MKALREEDVGFMIHKLKMVKLPIIPIARFGLRAKPSPGCQIAEKNNGGGCGMQTRDSFKSWHLGG